MPWRGPEVPGEFPTLGYTVASYIEDSCVIPDGDHMGEPYGLTDPMLKFLLWYYRIDPETGRFVYYRGGQFVRPQKYGKGPFTAAMICAEADGPVLFAGWDARGEPVGRPWATPLIQPTAVSEDQTDNVWRALVPMIELGPLKADIPDSGETRINLPGGGRIEPVTAAARSRLGQRVTFVPQDQTESWTKSNGGRALADNQRRNLAGMNGRFLETPNAWDPLEESVAQQTNENPGEGVYIDDVDPGPGSVKNKRDRRKMLKRVYEGSWWVDLDRIDGEIEALIAQGDPQQAERWFLNRKRAQEGAAFEPEKWDALADATEIVPDKGLIVLGVVGSRFDTLAIVGTEVESGHQFVVRIFTPPEGESDYEHPTHEIDAQMQEVYGKYEVWRAYVNPTGLGSLPDTWEGRWDKKVVAWEIARPTPMARAVRQYVSAVNAGDFTHDGDSVMAAHIRNSRKQKVNVYDEDRKQMWVLAKDRPGSPRNISGAKAGVLSWEARGDAIAAGAKKQKRGGVIW